MKNNYTIQFFHGLEGVWKDIKTVTTLDEAKAFMQAQIEMCGGCVDFHIMETN